MDRQQFLHCFHSLHLHQTGSQRRRGSDTGPWVEDTVHGVIMTGGLTNFSEKVLDKSTSEKRQIRMSCVLYPYSQKLIAHVECRG